MDFLQLFVDNALTKEAVFFLKNAYFISMRTVHGSLRVILKFLKN